MAVRSSFRPPAYQLNLTSVNLETSGDLYVGAANLASAGLTELIANVFLDGAVDGLVLEVRESVDGGLNWDFGKQYTIPAGKAVTVSHRVTCDTLRLRLQPQTAAGDADNVRVGVVCHTDPPKTRAVQMEGAADAEGDAAGDFTAARVSAGGSLRTAPAPPVYPADYQLEMATRASEADLFEAAGVIDTTGYQYVTIVATQSATATEAPNLIAVVFGSDTDAISTSNMGQIVRTHLLGPVADSDSNFNLRTRVVHHRVVTKFIRVAFVQERYVSPDPPYTEDAEGTQYPIEVQVSLHEDVSALSSQEIATQQGPLGGTISGDLFTVVRGFDPANTNPTRQYNQAHVVDGALKVLPVGGIEQAGAEINTFNYMTSDGLTFQIGQTVTPTGAEGLGYITLDTLSVSNLSSSGVLYVHLVDGPAVTDFEASNNGILMFTVPVEANTTKTVQYRVSVVHSLAVLVSDRLDIEDGTASVAPANQVTAVVTFRDQSP